MIFSGQRRYFSIPLPAIVPLAIFLSSYFSGLYSSGIHTRTEESFPLTDEILAPLSSTFITVPGSQTAPVMSVIFDKLIILPLL